MELAKANPDWYAVNQYHNPRNADAHQASTGPEVWSQTNGGVTHFVMTASTGGTITGTSRHLKEQNPNVKVRTHTHVTCHPTTPYYLF